MARKRGTTLAKAPPLRLEWRSPAELAENPRNWRRHPDAQMGALADVIAEVGWAGACLYNERTGRLIDGHARRKVALQQGCESVPVLVGDWDEAAEAKILATLDPLAAMAEADAVALQTLLANVSTDSAALQAMLDGLAQSNGVLPEPGGGGDDFDATPEQEGPTRTSVGEMWVIGGVHRLLVGDGADEANHNRLVGGDSVDLVLTDPPYGVGVQYGSATDDSPDFVMATIKRALPLMRRWPVVLITSGVRLLWRYPEPDWILAWVHPAGMGSGPWGFTCLNPVLAYGADPYLKRQLGRRADAIVLAADRDKIEGHPVIKPLKAWEWFLERGSPAQGETVLDPFLGSGTTLIAAHRLGRRCYGCEIEPRYADVILKRAEAEGLTCEPFTS